MNSDIMVMIDMGKEFSQMILSERMSDLPEMCPFQNENVECEIKKTDIDMKKSYDSSSGTFRIVIPPKHSLILDRPINFFGFQGADSSGRLWFMSNIKSLTIITSDGKRILEGKEILKSFSKRERHWWDLRIDQLY